VPDWLIGWWTVYDGQYYYYYFRDNGKVIYIKKAPNKIWVPPEGTGSSGTFQFIKDEITFRVTWSKMEAGEDTTVETFTRVGWTSTTEMNGDSSKYAPLFARKM
jgi:hypothetical protein